MKNSIPITSRFVFILLTLLVLSACSGSAPAPYIAIKSDSVITSVLKDTGPDFPGMATFIDTKVVFQGGALFLGVPIADTAKALVTKNITSFLESPSPVFDAALSPVPTGVTVDASLKKITYTDNENSISWLFTGHTVVRTFTKTVRSGDLTGSSYSSVWNYSFNASTGLTTATINDYVNETSLLKHTNKIASYQGDVVFTRSTDTSSLKTLTSADFSQSHTETNSSTALTWTQNGNVKMVGTSDTAGTLAFDGSFSFDIPTYNRVAGLVSLANGTYGMGFSSASNSYSNQNNISNGSTLILKSQTDYATFIPVTNALALRGDWLGTFTDTCSTTGPGKIELSILEATATWYATSQDSSRFYGTLISINTTGVHLKNNALPWGDSSNISDTTIVGTWSDGGCGGIFNISKQ